MGCCLCHPLSDVEQNPAISTYTEVGDIVIAQGVSVRQVKGCCNGLMYIQGDSLYYETKLGGRLCCRCCRYRLKLSSIDIVDILNNEMLRFVGGAIHLTPGLRISAYPNITVLVVMPDAAIFGPQLAEASNREKDKDGGRREKEKETNDEEKKDDGF